MEMIIVNDIQQYLNPKIFKNGPWLHIATVQTPPMNVGGKVIPSREFVCFKHVPSDKVYIEKLELTSNLVFEKIKDENLFNDIKNLLVEKGLLTFGVGKDFKFAK